MNSQQITFHKKKNFVKINKPLLKKVYRQRYLLIMLLPAFILTIIFAYIPLAGWIIAFKNYRVGFSIWDSQWTGLEQFKTFFIESSDFIYVIRNTVVMNASTIVINLLLALVFAILMKEIFHKKFAKTIQTVSFFPFFISWVITYAIIHSLFGSSSGAVNEALVKMGAIKEPLNIIGGKEYSWMLIIIMNAWKYLGYNSILFLASIAGIPSEEYEAAEIDGAGRFGKIRYITIPNLMPTLVVLLILNSGWILNSNFEQFYLFTNPTNWETMEVFDMYIYKFGLKLLNFPYATAVGIIKSIVSIGLLLGVNSICKKISDKAIF